MTSDLDALADPLRDRAVKQLKKRRDFMSHLLVYVLVNSFIVLIWAIINSGGFFWPIFPMVGWGIGVVMNAWDVWHPAEFDEDQIRREVARIRQKQ
jgi:hypothetical protein